ncbi:MAG: HAD family phosphatase [Armatimonadetes bacterium]|nr:HAD family phosphatase [Armatimonadota bacterium]
MEVGKLAVLWDLNGVIIDDMQVHLGSFQALMRELGSDMTEEYLIARCVGAPPHEVFADILPTIGNPISIEEAVARKRELYFELIRGKMRMLPGVRSLLTDLKCNGISQAVASGATRIEVEAILDEFGIGDYFEAVVACDDVSHGKPNPEPFLRAAAMLGVEPSNCVVIEDGEFGVRAAKTCGMRAIAVTNTQPSENLAAADVIVDSLEDMDAARVLEMLRQPEPV